MIRNTGLNARLVSKHVATKITVNRWSRLIVHAVTDYLAMTHVFYSAFNL
jgi:hypothetical protein